MENTDTVVAVYVTPARRILSRLVALHPTHPRSGDFHEPKGKVTNCRVSFDFR
jgi:hypothetical protein